MKALEDLAAAWPQLSTLLDEALELPPAERQRWLRSLPLEHAALHDTLARLLELPPGPETRDLLRTLPKLRGVHAANAAPPPSGMPRVGDEIGRYRLLRELGEGGMGSVWLAERIDGQLRRQVALKLPRLGWARGLAERMERERDILASLEHPQIARLYDAGVDPLGRPWLALEFVDGQPIDVYCRERRLGLRDRVALLLQVSAAVSHAHSRLVIHRDLKPSNILVTAEGEVRLLDFGVAKLLGDSPAKASALTELVGRAMTLRYASPEQVRGAPLTTASDVYSLGVVAYELLAGTSPYPVEQASPAALEQAIFAAELPLASNRADDPVTARALRGDLDAVLAQALRVSAPDRYPTVQALADDLRRWLADEAVQARPEPRLVRLTRSMRRHRLPFAAAAAVLISLMTGIGVALWQAQIARSEARTSQAVQRFLEGILGASDPNQADPEQARNRTARELMDIGARRIETDLAADPLAQARVMGTLANIYDAMGVFDECHRLRELRVGLLARTVGPTSSEHLLALSELAICQSFVGRAESAQQTLQTVERRLAEPRPLEPSLRAQVLVNVAAVLDTRDPLRALSAAREATQLLEPAGPSPALATAWAKVGAAASNAQRPEEARAALHRARELARAGGSMPASLADTLSNLGRIELTLGNDAQAQAALREALQLVETTIGPQSRQAIMARSALAELLRRTGHLAEAVELHREARERLMRLPPGQRGADTLASMVSYEAAALRQFGHLEDGLQCLAEAFAAEDRQPMPVQHRIGLLNQRALLLVAGGRTGPAQQALDATDRAIAEAQLQTHPVAAAAKLARSRWLALQGRTDEARDLLEHAVRQLDGVDLAQASHPGDLTLAARIDIAGRRWGSAIEWAERALARTPNAGMQRGFEAAAAWHALGVARAGAGQAAEAVEAMERAVLQYESLVDTTRSPDLKQALADYARALRLARRAKDARTVEQRSERIGLRS